MTRKSERSSTCVGRLKVLADETRLSVLEALMERPRHVGSLGREVGVGQSLLSHHLRVLREAGLVEARRDGRAVLYCLAPGVEGAVSGKSIDLGCCRLSFPDHLTQPGRRSS
ncbi:MAG: ArsR/SmtB family transcription factor [Acidobacteriota bacterium]